MRGIERLLLADSKFDVGARVLSTPGALRTAEAHRIDIVELLEKHVTGQWDDLDPEDRAANYEALDTGARIISWFGEGDARLMIITEAKTSACPQCLGYSGRVDPDCAACDGDGELLEERRLGTTVLRPDEY
jgi:hypothetical protein